MLHYTLTVGRVVRVHIQVDAVILACTEKTFVQSTGSNATHIRCFGRTDKKAATKG